MKVTKGFRGGRLVSSRSPFGARLGGFNPAALFGLADTGWVYDHSDFSTLFQDAAGTIPVTDVVQPVGLQLDKSKGLVLGPELVTNGTFDEGATGWTVSGEDATHVATFAGGKLRYQSNTTSPILSVGQAVVGMVAGKYYRIEVTIVDYVSGSIKTDNFSPIPGSISFGASGNGVYVAYGVASGGIFNIVRNSANVDLAIDNISVKELAGNHRTQSISLNRPTLLQDDGGLYYLSYDGINDSMATASFAWGTDKATVVAGVRKLSDALRGMLYEFSSSSVANNGTFWGISSYSGSGSTTGAFWNVASKGTTLVNATSSNTFPAPQTAVHSHLSDISLGRLTLRINGTRVAQSSADQGTGNFGTYQTFFGARAGTSLYFNGREYSQFAINRVLTADELAQIEAYTAGKTGVVL